MFAQVDGKAYGIQIFLAVVYVAMLSTWINTYSDYKAERQEVVQLIAEQKAAEIDLPPVTPSIVLGIGSLICLVGWVNSLRLRRRLSALRRQRLTQASLWIVAIGVLVGWLPTDFAQTQFALFGQGAIGERPSSIAYAGKLILIALLVFSFPVAAMLHYRSSLLDQYVVRNFLTPFSFCLIGFIAIWLIADLTDNAPDLAGAGPGVVLRFYVIQLPFMVLFVMPVTLLLSLLYTLSRMSKSNELISMLGAGRSIVRVLLPIFLVGLYCSLICLVFKYEWAPRSEGYKDALLEEVKQAKNEKRRGRSLANPYQSFGWLYVNEVDHRTWFIGRVPYELQKRKMDNIAIWQFDENDRLVASFRANSAKWFFGLNEWRLSQGKTYIYDHDGIPRVQSWDFLNVRNWRETPWKVVSSAQDPEYLGIPGLTTYLKNNADYDPRSLAPFRTNWWYCWAEPLSCFVMVLIAAPLGIVYSRRGVLGGVAASIVIFALSYFLSGAFVHLGQAGRVPPFIAAWATNFIFGLVGAGLLFFRARNREIPTPKVLLSRWRANRAARAAADQAPVWS